MSDSVHLLIPFAACSAAGCREALQGLALPQLEKLLARMAPAAAQAPISGDEYTLSPPHERALAAACGLAAPDGQIPWAAWQVQQAQQADPAAPAAGGQAWAWITPCHWRVATDHITMTHPQALQLDAQDAQALLSAMRPYFEQDGITLQYDAPTQWLAHGEVFRSLATASLDRVIGRNIDAWMPEAARAGPLRRLQNEMQMLLYTHEVNEARVRGGQMPVNSFWVSGTGALPPGAPAAPPKGLQMTHYLRDAALREDWPAWAAAWQELDARDCSRLAQALARGEAVTLTLCGERSAQSWTASSSGKGSAGALLARLAGWLRAPRATDILQTL